MNSQQRLALVVAILASFVAFLDGSVVNVALPAISRELGGGLSTQQWVVDGYLITLGALILLAGSLSDVFGRIPVMRIGLWGFGIASLLCAVAPVPEFLIAARVFQGVAGALLVPSSLALIMSMFSGGSEGHAIGSWTAWTSAAFIAGPIVGGAFVDLLSWRLVFAINVIPIALTLVLMQKLKATGERVENAKVDYFGGALTIVGIGGPVFALIEQATFGWSSPLIFGSLIVGLIALALFLVRQARSLQPMMPLALFTVRNFSYGNLATLFIYAALGMSGFVLVVFLQQEAAWPATLAGMAALPVTIILMLLSTVFGKLSGRFGPRLFMTIGPIIAGLGHLMMLMVTEQVDYWWQLLPGILMFGLGLSITVAPLTSAVLGDVKKSQSGIASAVNNAVARIAGLVAVAFLGIITATGLDLAGLHRSLIVCAGLLFLGGIVSFAGIRNPRPHQANLVAH
ncbi:MAG: MFS transporter [Microbacteriaceae bacterium]|nr:MFS transporter [Cryobacterium sp.]MCC6376951.1 MFS transporter [Microbacteriaceae bacterium]